MCVMRKSQKNSWFLAKLTLLAGYITKWFTKHALEEIKALDCEVLFIIFFQNSDFSSLILDSSTSFYSMHEKVKWFFSPRMCGCVEHKRLSLPNKISLLFISISHLYLSLSLTRSRTTWKLMSTISEQTWSVRWKACESRWKPSQGKHMDKNVIESKMCVYKCMKIIIYKVKRNIEYFWCWWCLFVTKHKINYSFHHFSTLCTLPIYRVSTVVVGWGCARRNQLGHFLSSQLLLKFALSFTQNAGRLE